MTSRETSPTSVTSALLSVYIWKQSFRFHLNLNSSFPSAAYMRRQTITRTNAVVNWTPGNKFQWISNRNLMIFIQENAFEIVVC